MAKTKVTKKKQGDISGKPHIRRRVGEIDVVNMLADLYKQATTEKSHYYTSKVIQLALTEILYLREYIKRHVV